jgi:hypothetical protein
MMLFGIGGCGSSKSVASDAGTSGHNKGDAAAAATSPDAGKRVKPRLVGIDLNPIAGREVTTGPDGEPVFGPVQPLDGAKICVVQRRDAFQVFQPFEKVEPPICGTSVAGQNVHVSDAPANSDLVLTIEHEGYRGLVVTARTGDNDTPAGWPQFFSVILLRPGALAPWIEGGSPGASDEATVLVGAGSWWTGPGVAKPNVLAGGDVFFSEGADGFAVAPGLHAVIEPTGGGMTIETTTISRFRVFSLPLGSARVQIGTDNPHLGCSPTPYAGLSTADTDSLEVPVLSGHEHWAGMLCSCGGDSANDELLDLPTCKIASGNSDADAGH